MWLLLRQKPRPIVVAACGVSIFGAWLLAGQGSLGTWEHGDILLVVADIGWALSIMLVPVFFARAQRPFFLAFVQYTVTAALGLIVSLLFEPPAWEGIRQAASSILYAGIVSGGFAFTLQIIAQKHTPTAEAALIMSLESVFAALAGIWLLGERLPLPALGGCALILLGVAMVEIGPLLRRKRAA
jgi:drug/metabolite transporter (DMT)-like permease